MVSYPLPLTSPGTPIKHRIDAHVPDTRQPPAMAHIRARPCAPATAPLVRCGISAACRPCA